MAATREPLLILTLVERFVKTPEPDTELLSRVTLRLPAGDLEQLRQAAFAARLPPAVLARTILIRALRSNDLPQPAPPATDELSAEAAKILAICHSMVSNLAQLDGHAKELGEPLSSVSSFLEQMREQARGLALEIKRGAMPQARLMTTLASLAVPSEQLNSLTRLLNSDRTRVPSAAWHAPLSSLQKAMAEV